MRTRDDQELVQLAISGDASSYGELFDRYQSAIFNYAYGLAGNRDDAGDIAQEAFVKVFEALPRMVDRQLDFKRYVYRTAHNVAMDAMRSRKHLASDEPLAFQEEPALFADPERAALLAEQRSKVRSAASELSDEQRAILEMRELHDMSYQEIADVLEMPRNTVGVYLARARLKLKGAFRMSYVDVDTLAAECQEMLPLLSAYLDEELEPARAEKVRAHLEECRFCTLALEEMTECSKSYRALIPLLPPAALKAAVWSRVGVLKDAPPAASEGGVGSRGGLRGLWATRRNRLLVLGGVGGGAIVAALGIGALVAGVLSSGPPMGPVRRLEVPAAKSMAPATALPAEIASGSAGNKTLEDPGGDAWTGEPGSSGFTGGGSATDATSSAGEPSPESEPAQVIPPDDLPVDEPEPEPDPYAPYGPPAGPD